MISVLYVDDEPGLLEVGKLYIERKGEFVVETVTSAEQALLMIEKGHYDAIVSDYQMPVMNGIDFLKQVRASGNSIPFIIFTGRGREEVVIQALNEGADFYLQKGGEPGSQFAELTHKVRQAVQQRRAEVSIRDHERREADILNFLPDATFAIDTNRVVIAWNRAIERMTGVRAEDIVGKGNYEYALPFYHQRRPILIDLVLTDDPATVAKYPMIQREGNNLFSEITIPHFNAGMGAALWFTASPLYNTRGEVIGAIESIREITERKKVLEALNESERRFRELADLLPQVIFEADEEGKILYANRIAFDTFGYSERDLNRGVNALDMIAPEDRDRAAIAFRQLLERGHFDQGTREYRAIRRDGSAFPVSIYSSPVFRNDKIIGVRGIIVDISSRITTEEKIRESEHNYRVLFENATEGILIAQQDRMVLVNPALVTLLGYSAEELTSRPFTDFIHPEDRTTVMGRHLQRMKGEIPHTGYTFRIIRSDGEERWVYINSTRIEWFGKPASLSFLTDMHEQKMSEQLLLAAHSEYTNLLDQIQDVYYRSDNEGRLIKASRSWATLLGYDTLEECLGRSIADDFYCNPADRKKFLDDIQREGKVTNYPVTLRRKDGTPVPVETSSHCYYDDAGNSLGIEGTFRDITERKNQEAVLHAQLGLGLALQTVHGMHEILNTCLDAAIGISGMDSGAIYLLDENGESAELVVSKNIGDAFLRSVLHLQPGSWLAHTVRGKKPVCIPSPGLEFQFTSSQEKEGLQSACIIPVISNGRGIACLNVSSHTDISIRESSLVALETIATQIGVAIERVTTEEALAESEQRYRNVVEDQTEFISRFLPDGTHVFVNDAYCRYFGFKREEILGHRFKPQIPEEERKRVMEFFESLTPENPVGTIRHRIIMPDSTIRWQQWSDRAIFDPDGNLVEYQSVGRDITDVKETELALHEKESWFRSFSDVSPDVIFMIDRDDRVAYVNNAAARMLGRAARDIIGYERSSLFPDDLSRNQKKAIEQVFTTGIPARSVGRMELDGNTRWFDHSLIPVRDESGTVVQVMGTSRDITEQKNAEEALLAGRERFRELAELLPLMVYETDQQSNITYLNRIAYETLGYSPEDCVKGIQSRSLIEPSQHARMRDTIQKILAGKAHERRDYTIIRKDGSRFEAQVYTTPIFRNGEVMGFRGVAVDITDQKKTEDTIRSLAQFPAENPNPVIRFSMEGALIYANDPGKRWLALLEDTSAEKIPQIVLDLIDNVVAGGGVFTAEVEDSELHIYKVTAIRPDNEQYTNVYVTDITERRDAERAIRETTAKLNLLTSVTRHDVANQITILQGYTQMALMKDPDPVIADFLKKIDAAGNAISRQIEFTRNYQDLGVQKPGWFGARKLLQKHTPEGISLSCTCDAEIYADPMLDKVFSNIIDNAIRHGERVTEIRVRCMDGPDGLSLLIEDNGVGVPYDKKEQIFQKGYGKHTGFGLFLSREILGITGITIHETGVPGKGARFELSIPKGKYRGIH